MQIISWRKPAKRTNHRSAQNESINHSISIKPTTSEIEAEQKSYSSKFSWEDVQAKPKTTWIWDRSRQAWVEIIEKPPEEEPPPAHDYTYEEPVAESSSFNASVLIPSEGKEAVYEPVAEKPTLPSIDVGAEVEESKKLILREAESQAQKIIAWAEERAKLWADKIIIQAQEKAEERVEIIIARAEEKAALQAESIIAKAESRAEALAENILTAAEDKAMARAEAVLSRAEEKAEAQASNIFAQAEEKARAKAKSIIGQAEEEAEEQAGKIVAQSEDRARAKARNIISQAEEEAEAQADNIVTRAEDRARYKAEKIMVEAEETRQQMLSSAEYKAREILNTAEDRASASRVPREEPSRAATREVIEQRETVSQKSRGAPHEGTAELDIKPPVDLNVLQKALKRLTTYDQIRILDLDGSVGKGVRVKLFTRNIARLSNIITSLPEVEQVTELPKKVGGFSSICPGQKLCPPLQKWNSPTSMRLLVKMKKRNTILEV